MSYNIELYQSNAILQSDIMTQWCMMLGLSYLQIVFSVWIPSWHFVFFASVKKIFSADET